MKRLLAVLFVLAVVSVRAQSTNPALGDDYYHRIDRYETKSGQLVEPIFTSVKPYRREAIIAALDTLERRQAFSSAADAFNLEYLRNDSWEWSHPSTNDSKKPFLKSLYRKKSDLVYVDQPDFDLHVNPVLYVGAGKDSYTGNTVYTNTRGVEIRGIIDGKIGFYTYFSDNQARLPGYATDYGNMYGYYSVPHQGFWKTFKNGGVDFFEARAYIDFRISKHIGVQFGHDRMNIGNGFRSLIWSDFAPPSQFLRVNAKIWKLNYLFQVNRMTAIPSNTAGGSTGPDRYPDKYVAFHHVSVNIGKKFNLGLFESVVFSPADTVNGGVFELSYLNPVIFYRAIEQQNGSSDNVLLGMDWKWLITKKVSAYGQFVLDEFSLKNLRAGDGWWGNKFALQAGLKYVDVAGISNLDLQLEANIVRPYTYSHQNLFTNYSNYLQPIAHPMGANFTEVAAIVRYQPMPRLNMTIKSFVINTGRDNPLGVLPPLDWGGDINKSYNLRMQEYNNKTTQGIDNVIVSNQLQISYMLRHNFFIDLNQTFRDSRSSLSYFDNRTSVSTVSLRWNFAGRTYDF